MGFKILEDYIGTLSHSAGVLTLQPSLLTMGGQQYRTSTLTANLSGLTANTLYAVYCVRNGSTNQLVVSTNMPSIGPAGFTRRKIVGAFYSNGLSSVAFGAFVQDIKSPTRADNVSYLPVVTVSSGTFNNVTLTGTWNRDGQWVKQMANAVFTSTPSNFTQPFLQSPTNIPMNPSNTMGNSGGTIIHQIGTTTIHDAGNQYYAGTVVTNGSAPFFAFEGIVSSALAHQNATQATPMVAIAGDAYCMNLTFAVTGWDNTPIIYL